MARVRVVNPTPSRAELLEELRELRAENERLKSQAGNGSGNPSQVSPLSSRSDLLAQIRELRKENDELQDRLDKIADVAEAPRDADEGEDIDVLKDKLNDILDIAAPDSEDEGDEGNE